MLGWGRKGGGGDLGDCKRREKNAELDTQCTEGKPKNKKHAKKSRKEWETESKEKKRENLRKIRGKKSNYGNQIVMEITLTVTIVLVCFRFSACTTNLQKWQQAESERGTINDRHHGTMSGPSSIDRQTDRSSNGWTLGRLLSIWISFWKLVFTAKKGRAVRQISQKQTTNQPAIGQAIIVRSTQPDLTVDSKQSVSNRTIAQMSCATVSQNDVCTSVLGPSSACMQTMNASGNNSSPSSSSMPKTSIVQAGTQLIITTTSSELISFISTVCCCCCCCCWEIPEFEGWLSLYGYWNLWNWSYHMTWRPQNIPVRMQSHVALTQALLLWGGGGALSTLVFECHSSDGAWMYLTCIGNHIWAQFNGPNPKIGYLICQYTPICLIPSFERISTALTSGSP